MDNPASADLDFEKELIVAAKQGDRNAFGELVKIYYPGTINVVFQMCGDQSLAQEAAQEAFIRAWQQIDRYQPRFAFRSWVYRIAINAAIDQLRKDRPADDIETISLKDGRDSPEAVVEKDERVERVRSAVLNLPEAARAVLILREYEDLSYTDIAAALNIPVGTVMSRLNYARGLLRKKLADDLEN